MMSRAIGIVLLFTALAVPAEAKWVLLGARTVSDRLDHDTITVTASRGEFTRLKFSVERVPVQFHRVVVRYGNGESDEIEMRERVRAGGETRAIDLRGGDRVIRTIDFWYDANSVRKKAVVRVWGWR